MALAPDPSEIFRRAAKEGERRLDQSMLELASTSFIAGFTVVFGIAALGIAHAAVEPRLGEIARIAGALAFAPGLVFLVVGRAELFNENFFDPVATAFERRESGPHRYGLHGRVLLGRRPLRPCRRHGTARVLWDPLRRPHRHHG